MITVEKTVNQAAGVISSQLGDAIARALNQFASATTNGTPANPQLGLPALTGAQVVAGFDPATLTKLNAALAALS